MRNYIREIQNHVYSKRQLPVFTKRVPCDPVVAFCFCKDRVKQFGFIFNFYRRQLENDQRFSLPLVVFKTDVSHRLMSYKMKNDTFLKFSSRFTDLNIYTYTGSGGIISCFP